MAARHGGARVDLCGVISAQRRASADPRQQLVLQRVGNLRGGLHHSGIEFLARRTVFGQQNQSGRGFLFCTTRVCSLN